MRITKLEYQKKDPNRINIFIDGKFAVGIDANDVLTLGLHQDLEVSQEKFSEILSHSEFGKIFNTALNFLSYRPRSEWEIRSYLHKKNQVTKAKNKGKEKDPETLNAYTDQVIDKLRSIGQINDKAFAEWFISQRQTFKPKGKKALVFELAQKGIKRDIVEEVLRDQQSSGEGISEATQALKIAEKRLKGKSLLDFEGEELEGQKASLTRFLGSRGFDWEIIREVIAKLAKKE